MACHLPRGPAAVLDALHFSRPRLTPLSDQDWREALDYCDTNRLTLSLAPVLGREQCPQWVGGRLEQNAASNRRPFDFVIELYRSVRGLSHLDFKRVSHLPYFSPDPALRPHYD